MSSLYSRFLFCQNQYSLFLFCADTKELFIITGSTHSIRVISSLSAFFIEATFSRRKYFGLTSLRSRTYSKKSDDFSPCSHCPHFFAIDKSWQGDPQMIISISVSYDEYIQVCSTQPCGVPIYETSVTLPIWIVSG